MEMEGGIKKVIMYWMLDGEMYNFIKVWLSVYISLSYCYFAGRIVPKGFPRFFAFLPVICLFLLLPLYLHSLHLGITTAFFIAWLSNFKLLLFAFHIGPLSNASSLSLPRFLAVACLPIRIQQTPPPHQNKHNPSENATSKQIPPQKNSKSAPKSILNYATKGLLLASIIKLYDYSHRIYPLIIWILYCFHIYFALEIILAIVATMARVLLGADLEPTFNEPLLSTSLPRFLGSPLEHHGHPYPTPLRVRTRPQIVRQVLGPRIGHSSRGSWDFHCVGPDARADILLHGPNQAHLESDLFLSAARGVFGCRDNC